MAMGHEGKEEKERQKGKGKGKWKRENERDFKSKMRGGQEKGEEGTNR